MCCAGIALFTESSLTDIILDVVRNAAIPGFLGASGHCDMDMLGQLLH